MSKQPSTKQKVITLQKNAVQSIHKKRSAFNLQPIDGALTLPEPTTVPDVSIIIPAYCEEETITEVLQRVIKVSWSLGNTEIIVVDDGSTDGTKQKVQQFPFVKYVRHEKNQGKGAAIRTGLINARGNILVLQDADLEYAPEFIPALVRPIANGSMDIVYGSRFKGKPENMTVLHFIGNSILSMVARLMYNADITDIMTGQKAFRKQLINGTQLEENGFEIEIELTSRGFTNLPNYTEIPIPYSYRQHGVSKIAYIDGFKSLIKLFSTYLRPTN
jgi:glycosyltransferase involved in cell wall biosynthesis